MAGVGGGVLPHFVSFVGSNPATWHAVEEKAKNHFTEIGEILEPTFLELMCFSKSHSEREEAQHRFPVVRGQRGLPTALLAPYGLPATPALPLRVLARGTANGAGTEVWK